MSEQDQTFAGHIGAYESPVRKPMNCNTWGTYETAGSSPTAGYCNGGTVDGELWAPCPSRVECREARNQRAIANAQRPNTRLTVVNQPPQAVYSSNRPTSAPTYSTGYGGASTVPQRPATPNVVTPANNNPYLDTARAGTTTDHSPTYLPAPEEHFARRLGANMVIGALESAAHHASSFLRNVDIFPFRGGPKK